MKVKVNTKSNYRKLNNKPLDVFEIKGTRVTCLYNDPEFAQPIKVDFQLNEVIEMDYKNGGL